MLTAAKYPRATGCVLGLLKVPFRLTASEATVNKITMPQKLIENLQRKRAKNASKWRKLERSYKGPLVIACKRSEYNHHLGQTYRDFTPQVLASHGWKHPKSTGDYFTLNSVRGNPALDVEDASVRSFSDLHLHEKLVEGLRAMKITKPTNIQALTVPSMLAMKNVLCAAETGSGKTLAYILPILQRLHEHRKCYNTHVDLNQPFGIILTPSRELADQLNGVVTELAQHVPLQVQTMCGGRGTKKLLRNCEVCPVDLLIATPGILSKLLTNRMYTANRLHHVVLDEADTLLDDSFNELTLRLLRKLKIQSERVEANDGRVTGLGTQVALVGATVPRSLEQILSEVVPTESIERVTTKSLHRLMPHVPQKFLRLGLVEKPEILLKLLQTNIKKAVPTIVFCNKSSTSSFLSYFLGDNNVSNVDLCGKMPEHVRSGRFQRFQDGEIDVLVCTDIASRGLDTTRAQHVINYDFPDFMSDYIHRVGRVGRISSKTTGFVVSFITRKWEVDLLWRIEAAARQVTELHNVNANIKRKLTGIIEKKFHQTEMEKVEQEPVRSLLDFERNLIRG